MSYSVYVQKFISGDSAAIDFNAVAAILAPHGTIGDAGRHLEFTPREDNLCEVAILSGSKSDGITGISFERPVTGRGLPELIFALLDIPGTCFYELDCSYVMARSDVTSELPEGLLEACTLSSVTVISSAAEVQL